MGVQFAIVVKPDGRTSAKISHLMRYVATKYRTYRAFRDPKGPHISLIYLDNLEKIPEKEIENIIKELKTKLSKVGAFTLEINGITYFRKKWHGKINYVVYLRGMKNKYMSGIYRICNNTIKMHNPYKFDTFVPHMSIARTDLNREQFNAILREFKDSKIYFKSKIPYICAMTRHNKRERWRIRRLPLS